MVYFNLLANQDNFKVKQKVSFEFECAKGHKPTEGGFAINFQNSHADYENIALQVCFRAPSNLVALNTCIKKKWGTEEHITCQNVKDLYYDKPFTLGIDVLTKNSINVYLNGQLKAGYECPVDLLKAEYMCISECISWKKAWETIHS
ncbi:uncharacterized protein [Mytilus edulis]|uniref:uncharacterized protein n=1 Tax=Mytilus edulis TaxID=6550 RepID=UPI0039F05047